jgi:2-hydroxychromene-2-carboxylate isomerase
LSCQIWCSVFCTAPGWGASQVGHVKPAPPVPPVPPTPPVPPVPDDELLDDDELDVVAPPLPEELDDDELDDDVPPPLPLLEDEVVGRSSLPRSRRGGPRARRRPRGRGSQRATRKRGSGGGACAHHNRGAIRRASSASRLVPVKRVDFYYDYSCPYAYLGSTQIEAIAARAGAEIAWRPMLLGGVFRAIGAPDTPNLGPAKARLNLLDMHRWADHFGGPLHMPEGHPNRTVLALRATLAAGEADIPRATKALFRAYWALGRDVSRPEVVRAALDEAGLDGAALVARAEDQAIKDALRARTDEAVARGVFGAPAFVVGDDLYWGQDRLVFVENALGGHASHLLPDAPSGPPAAAEVSFFFDVSSPFAYLASTQIEAVAARNGARVRFRPFLLGGLFKAIGTPDVPLFTMPAPKRAHAAADMNRWAAHYGVPLNFPSRFPMNTVKALRMILALPEEQRPPLVHALYRAFWVDDRDLADDAELAAIAAGAGLDGAALVAATKTDAAKERLKDATNEAVRLGLFGAPTFQVGDVLIWGQDRLLFVEKALRGWRPDHG